MAGKVTGLVLDHFHGDPLAKLVLLTLADRANEQAICWPSRGDICARSGASPATVTRKLRWLEAEGWIARRQRFQTSAVFRINLARLLLAASVAERFRAVPNGFKPFSEESVAQVVDNKDDDHSEHKNDHCEHENDHLDDHLTVKKPIKEPSEKASLPLKGGSARFSPFQRTLLREGKTVLVGGHLLVPGSLAFQAAALAAKLQDAENEGRM